MTGDDVPIILVLHTPGGLILAAQQNPAALSDHPASVAVHIRHPGRAMAPLCALAADEIVTAPSAVLGPVDPQLGEYPASSMPAAVESKDPNATDGKT
jgi:ClpP class serine protease